MTHLSVTVPLVVLAAWTLPLSAQTLPKSAVDGHFVVAESVRLHYVEAGSGRPVVFLHGNDGTLQDFTMSMFNKAAAKYHTLAFDRPGHGESESIGHQSTTPETQARIIHKALDKLLVDRPILVAHSWSGSLALSYTLQFPNDLSAVVLLGPSAYENGKPPRICYLSRIPVLGTVLSYTSGLFAKHWVKTQLEDAFSPDPAPKAYVKKFLSSMFRTSQIKAAASDELSLNDTLRRISQDYGKIKVPVVIVTGNKDKIVPPQLNSYPLHKAIAHSRLMIIPNAGHELQFTRPDEVMNAIAMATKLSDTTR